MNFREFINENKKNMEDVDSTLTKIPQKHKKLLSGYKINFVNGHTLPKDDENVGVVDSERKKIVLAAPWNYSREFTLLHEVGHLVWDNLLSDDEKKEWIKLSKSKKDKIKQNSEELFCMAYANYYVKNKVEKYLDKKWDEFIVKISN